MQKKWESFKQQQRMKWKEKRKRWEKSKRKEITEWEEISLAKMNDDHIEGTVE